MLQNQPLRQAAKRWQKSLNPEQKMSRTLILTPYEHGFLAAMHYTFNKGPFVDESNQIDIPHLLLSALTMSGVDSITSFGKLTNTNTTLIRKLTTKASAKKWSEIYQKSQEIIEPYKNQANFDEVKADLDDIKHRISQLLFSLKTNSGIISFSNFTELKNKESLPIELSMPLNILMNSVQTKSANLPILKYETEKKDVKRFMSILESIEFKNYKDAQSEIEQNQNLTNKTIRAIEIAGKDLYKKNLSHIELRENALKAIPLTGKVVDLFFGKLPGILTDFSTNLVGDFLKSSKSIPIYNCGPIIEDIRVASLRARVLKYIETQEKDEGIR